MTMFADTLSDLRYTRGLVSFRLHASGSSSPGSEVAMPFAGFAQMMQCLEHEAHKLTIAHQSWLAREAAAPSAGEEPVKADVEEDGKPPALGKRLASI